MQWQRDRQDEGGDFARPRAGGGRRGIGADPAEQQIKQTAGFHLRLDPMHAHLVAEVRPAILALMGAALFLLLIACANVANLLLVRASLRARELAVRTALGASWRRLAGQILAEALLLAAIGGAGGVALAWVGIHELRAIAPADLPRLNTIAIDPAVLGFQPAGSAGFGGALWHGSGLYRFAAGPDRSTARGRAQRRIGWRRRAAQRGGSDASGVWHSCC